MTEKVTIIKAPSTMEKLSVLEAKWEAFIVLDCRHANKISSYYKTRLGLRCVLNLISLTTSIHFDNISSYSFQFSLSHW